RFAEHRDVYGEISFLYKSVGPHYFHELFFFQHEPGITDQHDQHLESLRRERDALSVAKQDSLLFVENERVELVNAVKCGIGRSLHRFARYRSFQRLEPTRG